MVGQARGGLWDPPLPSLTLPGASLVGARRGPKPPKEGRKQSGCSGGHPLAERPVPSRRGVEAALAITHAAPRGRRSEGPKGPASQARARQAAFPGVQRTA